MQRKNNSNAGRPKKDTKARSSPADEAPISGPFSLGPSAISRAQSRIPAGGALNYGLSSATSMSIKEENKESSSELAELQHLNAASKIEERNTPSLSLPQDSLFLLQLPSLVPCIEPWFLAQRLAAVKMTTPAQLHPGFEDIEKSAYSALLKQPSIDGKIGKVQIHRSGKLTLSIGPMSYRVLFLTLIL